MEEKKKSLHGSSCLVPAKVAHLKSTRTAMKKVWKLQFLLICVSSSIATLPNV